MYKALASVAFLIVLQLLLVISPAFLGYDSDLSFLKFLRDDEKKKQIGFVERCDGTEEMLFTKSLFCNHTGID